MRAADADLDLDAVLARLSDAVREGGALALQKSGAPFKHWLKNNTSPVTEADIAVDELLRERLTAIVPDCGWLSEESEDDLKRLDHQRVWIVDPIDGTRAFIAGHTDWVIAAALAQEGRPIAAAIFAPAEDTLLVAAIGRGATVNGRSAMARAGDDLAGAVAAGPKSRLDAILANGHAIEPVPRVHSLALLLARVASGVLDIAFAGGNSHDWDIAAADLIVHEAGGALTAFDGSVVIYNRPDPVHGALVAAGRERHAALLQLMRSEPAAFA